MQITLSATAMASPLRAILSSLLLLVILLPNIHANIILKGPGHHVGHLPKHHRPSFAPGPWKQAHATFYGNPDGSGADGRERNGLISNPGLICMFLQCFICLLKTCVGKPRLILCKVL